MDIDYTGTFFSCNGFQTSKMNVLDEKVSNVVKGRKEQREKINSILQEAWQ